MISIYALKPKFQKQLQPIASGFIRIGVSANTTTICTALACIAYGALLASYQSSKMWLALPVVFFLRMVLNALDGMIAIQTNQQSRLGAVLNELGDAASDFALYAPLLFVRDLLPAAALMIFISALTEVAGLSAALVGQPRNFAGPMGKSDRALGCSLIALGVGLQQPILYPKILLWTMCGMGLLCMCNRVRAILR
jgi:CDP-diacylglycerol---glycerol-3-phosphate 3-phosphatidyltransferase